jgi:hypothetical protein
MERCAFAVLVHHMSFLDFNELIKCCETSHNLQRAALVNFKTRSINWKADSFTTNEISIIRLAILQNPDPLSYQGLEFLLAFDEGSNYSYEHGTFCDVLQHPTRARDKVFGILQHHLKSVLLSRIHYPLWEGPKRTKWRQREIAELFTTNVPLTLIAGSPCDALDREKRWFPAIILGIEKSRIRIHFLIWPSFYDEWISTDDIGNRLKPRGEMILYYKSFYDVRLEQILDEDDSAEFCVHLAKRVKR